MRGKNHFARNLACGGIEVQPLFFHAAANRLKHRKAAVSLVQMQHSRRDAHRLERAKAANAQQQLLANARPPVATIEPRRQLAILGRIPLHIRVQQQQIAAAHLDPPHLCLDRSTPRLNLHHHRLAVLSDCRLHRQLIHVGLQVLFPLPAAVIQPLQKVALPVKQPNPNQRNVQVGRAFDVVARQHAQAAGINWQRFMQPELRGEVGHRTGPQHARVGRAPGPVRLQIFLLSPIDVIDAAMQHQFGCAAFDFAELHLVQQRDGILIQFPPARGIQIAKQADAVVVPAPPDVTRQRP